MHLTFRLLQASQAWETRRCFGSSSAAAILDQPRSDCGRGHQADSSARNWHAEFLSVGSWRAGLLISVCWYEELEHLKWPVPRSSAIPNNHQRRLRGSTVGARAELAFLAYVADATHLWAILRVFASEGSLGRYLKWRLCFGGVPLGCVFSCLCSTAGYTIRYLEHGEPCLVKWEWKAAS